MFAAFQAICNDFSLLKPLAQSINDESPTTGKHFERFGLIDFTGRQFLLG